MSEIAKIKIYKNVIFPVRKEPRLSVLENRVLTGTFGTGSCKIIGGRRKVHNESLYNL
jgi:hypothetical protein